VADEQHTHSDTAEEPFERPIDRFRRSTTGSILAAGLLGLGDALEGRRDREDPAIMSEAPEREPGRPLEVTLDFEHPERSVAVVRPSQGD